MDENGEKMAKSEPTGDWRAEFTPETRRGIVQILMRAMNRNLPLPVSDSTSRGVIELCTNLEEEPFHYAKSKDIYTNTILAKLLSIQKSSPCTVAASLSNPGLTQTIMVAGAGQGSSVQHASPVSRESTDGSAGQEIQSNFCGNTLREIPTSQSSQKVVAEQQQELQHQFSKHKAYRPSSCHSPIEPGNFNNQQEQHTVSQPSQLQCSQQPMLSTEQHKPQLVEQLDSSAFEQNLLSQYWKSMRTSSDALLQPQNVIDQQKLLHSPEVSSASVESTAPGKVANIVAWQDEAYQKLQSMKKECLPRLIHLLNQFRVAYQKYFLQLRRLERAEQYKKRIISLQEMIEFLSMPRSGMVQSKTKFDYSRHVIIRALSNNSFQQPEHSSVNFSLTSTPVATSPSSSTQKGLQSSVNSGSLMRLEQRNTPSSLLHTARAECQNTTGSQQENSFHNTSVNAFDSAINSSKQSSIMNPFQQQNQQLKHQKTKPQNLNQQSHPQFQQKMQQVPIPNIRPVATSGMLQQHPSISQPSECPYQMPLLKTHQNYATAVPPPHMSQYSSCQIDQQNFPSPAESVRSSDSVTSLLVTSFASTPLTSSPFSILAECASPLSTPENFEHPQTAVALTQTTKTKGLNQSLSIASPGISASLPNTERTSPGGNQESSAMSEPIKRLIKAVESISPKALSAAVSEIGLVMRMADMTAGIGCNDSISAIDENLAYETSCRLQASNSSLQYGCSSATMLTHNISSTALTSLTENDIVRQSIDQKHDLDSTTETSTTKRRRIEELTWNHRLQPSNGLSDEIRYINQQLLETAVTLDSNEDTAILDAGEGIMVRCVYTAVAIDNNLKMQYASLTLPVPLWLLVPANYPNSSPIILNCFTVDLSCGSKESLNLLEKTRVRFNILLGKLSEPVSLAEMVAVWDVCARTEVLEYAKQVGGELFSSRYGTWEDCVTS